MSASALLIELLAAGVALSLKDEGIRVQTRPGVSIARFRERIAAHKPALIEELLQREIEAVVTVEPEAFDRQHYDQLWNHWRALHPPEVDATPGSEPSSQSISVARDSIEASVPPPDWDGRLCIGCQWPEFCRVLGPRGPQLPGGPCPTYPTEAVGHDNSQHELSIAAVLTHLTGFTPEELEAFRREVADATDDDPYSAVDRAALARFDSQFSHTLGVSA